MKPSLDAVESKFQKVGECLYRYSSNGVYYARIKTNGKEIRRSLETTDRDTAKRELARLRDEQRQVDRSQGKLTLAELCERYLQTIQRQKPKTIERKALIVRRMQEDWPTGKLIQIAKIKPSDVELWLSRYSFGPVSRNLHVACAREVFEMAMRDNVIPRSPVSHLRSVKLEKPIRRTPTFEEFKAIISDIRAQPFNADATESADFVEFLGLAGLGQAEASALTQADIDWQRGTITTFRQKTKSGFAIPLYPQVKPLLLRRRRPGAPNESVFSIRDAKKAIAGACRRLRLPQYTHRSFRRMFITRAIERGVDVKVIAEWQGHKDGGRLILSTYSHVNRAHSNRMAQLMTDALPENVVSLPKASCDDSIVEVAKTVFQ
jgi:integrase